YLLRKSAQTIGAILIRRTGNQIFPQMLAVDAAQRGSGLGNLLLGAALEACSNKYPDLDETVWDVFQGFDRLEAWYERLGGVETDRKGLVGCRSRTRTCNKYRCCVRMPRHRRRRRPI